MDAYNSSSTKPLYRGTQIIWYVGAVIESLLAFRFILKLLGANMIAGFTNFIYSITQPFVAPFTNVFQITKAEGSVFEWTTLLAMLVYWLIVMAIARLLVMGKTVTTPEAAVKLSNQDR